MIDATQQHQRDDRPAAGSTPAASTKKSNGYGKIDGWQPARVPVGVPAMVLAACLLAWLSPCPTHAQFGTQTVLLSETAPGRPMTKVEVDRTIAAVSAAGYTWVRDYVFGPTATKLDGARIGWWLDAVAANHLTPLVRIDYRRGDPAGYAAWAEAVVTRFAAVKYFEVGNEWDGPPANRAAWYYAQLAAVSAAIRRVRPDAVIWGGVLTSPGQFFHADSPWCDLSQYTQAELDLGWGGALLDLGASTLVDKVSVHMYWPNLPETSVPGCSTGMQLAALPAQMEEVEDQTGLGTTPVTESGWPRQRGTGTTEQRQRQQAVREVRMELAALYNGWLPRFNYTLVHHVVDDTQQEQSFNIVTSYPDLTPLPVYYAVQRLHQLLNGAIPTPNAPLIAGADYHQMFRMRDGRTAHALWNSTTTSTIPWSGGGWLVDLVGRTTVAAAPTVPVSSSPVLVVQ